MAKTNETNETQGKTKKRRKKGKVAISTKGFGPDISSNDRFALSAATKIEITRLGAEEGRIKASLDQSSAEDSPWSGSAELWRDIPVGWYGEAGKLVETGAHTNPVLQSVWKQIGEADKVSMTHENGLIKVRILKKSHKTCLTFIVGRASGKQSK